MEAGRFDKESLMEQADLWLKLEDKLKREWSTLSVTAGLTPELLRFASSNLAAIEPGVKIRLLLSLLLLKPSELDENKSSVVALLQAATKDADPWPQVLVDLVCSRLSASRSEGKSGFIDKSEVKSTGIMESATSQIVSRLLEVVAKDHKMDNEENKQTDDMTFPIPLDFFPMEWPYLCSNLLQGNLNLEECGKNIHFTPLAMTSAPAGVSTTSVPRPTGTSIRPANTVTVNNARSAPSAIDRKQQLQMKTAAALEKYRAMAAGNRALSSNRGSSGVKLVDFEAMEREMEQNRKNNAFTKKRLQSVSRGEAPPLKQAKTSDSRAPHMESSPGPDSSPGSYDPSPVPSSYPIPSPSPPLGSPMYSPGYGSPQSPGSPGSGNSLALLNGANKMSESDRELVTRFLNGEPNPDPAKGDVRTILHSVRKSFLAGSSKQIVVAESIFVRINFKTKKFSKLKKKKQFKVKRPTGPQSPT